MRAHRPSTLRASLGAALLVGALAAASPGAAGLLEVPLSALPGADAVPNCDDAGVLADVQDRFAAGSAGMLRADLSLVALDKVRQTHPLETKPSAVARRYCVARGHISNGRAAPVYFLVEQRLGFVGQGWLVTACVNGYDRWHVNDGTCRAVRHWW